MYVGWEGTANDGRVFKDAVTGDSGLEWPTDGLYLVLKMPLIYIGHFLLSFSILIFSLFYL
jgi:hypothetical protein